MKKIAAVLVLAFVFVGCSGNKVNYPIMYIDMDGTLLSEDHEILDSSIEAIEKYRACGGKVGIATGRNVLQVKDYLPKVKPDLPIVIYNGAVTATYNPTDNSIEVLRAARMSEGAFRKILREARSMDDVGSIVMECLNERVIDEIDPASIAYFKKVGISWERIDSKMVYKEGDAPVKVVMYVANGRAAQVADELKERLGDDVVVKQGNPFVVDITPRGQIKSAAIRDVVQKLGYKFERDVMAFGDSGNDKEMLAEAAFGAAMANCKPTTCETAKLIIGPNKYDSIAKAIRTIAIGPGCKD